MTHPHFFPSADDIEGDRVRLIGADAHHASRVLRLKVGETISAADGNGRVVDAVLTKVTGELVEGRIILSHDRASAAPYLVLYQGVAKGERMEFVVQKAVEVGARLIVPFLAMRTIVRWDAAKRAKAHQRLQAVAAAAAKQCRAPWMSEVAPVAAGVGGLELVETTVVLHEEGTTLLRAALPADPPERLGVVVGPEGGLDPAEVAALEATGARAVTLGERVLRTETAGPVALALVSFVYGGLG